MTEPITCTEGTPLGWTLHVARNNQMIIRRMRSSDLYPYSVTELKAETDEGRGESELVMCGNCMMYVDRAD